MNRITSDFHWAQVPEALLCDPTVGAWAVRTYGLLMRHGMSPDNCFPSHEELAESMGASVATVRRALDELVAQGWVTKTERWRPDGGKTSNGYHLHQAPNDLRVEPAPPTLTSLREARRARRVEPLRSPASEPLRSPASEPLRSPASDERESLEPESVEPEPREESHVSASPARRKAPVSGEDARRVVAATELAHHLAARIEESDPEALRPNVTKAWVTTMERIIRIDGRDPEKIRAAIDWVFTNPAGEFWIANVRSPQKLREQYDRLRRDAMRAQKAETKREDNLTEMARRAMARNWGPEPDALDVTEAERAIVPELPEWRSPDRVAEDDRAAQQSLLSIIGGIGFGAVQ